MYRRIKRLHMVGIGGSGMSGIAEVLINLGYEVSGSDLKNSTVTRRLESLGARVIYGHSVENIADAEVVVYSSAIKPDNPEILEAHRRRIPVVPRAEMLSELMRMKYGIAIGGTHGKTTTTSLVASVIAAGGYDPTVVIGGRLNSIGTSAKLGKGEFMVVEADESDGSFLKLSPVIVIVTNIDREHMEYYLEFSRLRGAFLEFINKVPFYGLAILCGDHPVVRGLEGEVKRRYLTYGLMESNVITCRIMALEGRRAEFDVIVDKKEFGRVRMNIPGRHNVQNALAAIAAGLELNVPRREIIESLREFDGIERRFQIKGEINGIMVVDDYGHHPEEIRSTIRAVKECWKRRLIFIFQPHRYTRTLDLLSEFHACFEGADYLILTEIYPAGEAKPHGVSAEIIWNGLKDKIKGRYIPDKESIPDAVLEIAKPGDIVLTMGAGDIWVVADALLRRLEQ